jgi:hypothetical protein
VREHFALLKHRWTTTANHYRYFRLLTAQRDAVLAKLRKCSSWSELQACINENLARIYAHPLSVFEEDLLACRQANRLTFLSGEFENVAGTHAFESVYMDDDEFSGNGYVMSTHIDIPQTGKRFSIKLLVDALASYGIYARNIDYFPEGMGRKGVEEAYYTGELMFLKKDWPLLAMPPSDEEETDEHPEEEPDPFDWDDDLLFDDDSEQDQRKREILESHKKVLF